MSRVHVWGASGYAAAEAIRWLERHPHFELGALESASHAGEALAAHFPLLRASRRSFDGKGAVLAAVVSGDAVLMGGAHGTAKEHAPAFLERDARVVDLSVDFRLDPSAVYGFPERYRDAITKAKLVANPGCYPTASLLALLPLAAFDNKLIQIVIDAKSGVTGAGRTPATSSLFAEVYGDVRAYGLNGHRHAPEIAQELKAVNVTAPFVFTPHVVPIARGMIADAYAIFERTVDANAVRAAYERAYASHPLIRLLPEDRAPSVSAVVGTADAEVHVSVIDNVVRAICTIDNLGKGAATQAVENLNLMFGYPEECGLDVGSVVV
jgi:N-acetyl-gamma-glutamyl-phosphate reductase